MTPIPVITCKDGFLPDLSDVKAGDYIYSPAIQDPGPFDEGYVILFMQILPNSRAREISYNTVNKTPPTVSEFDYTETNLLTTQNKYEFFLCTETEYITLLFQYGLAGV